MEYRISLTIAKHGYDGDAAEKALDAFLEFHPETGPVVTQNTATGGLTITIGLDATDPWAAGNLAGRILTDGLNGAHLEVVPILDVSITAVDPTDSPAEQARWNLVPA